MSPNRKRILKIFGIIVAAYVVFAIIILILFHYVSTNPMDKAAITYLRSSADVEERYGNIIHIGRNLLYDAKESESSVKAPYTLETENGLVTVYVTLLINGDENFKAVSYEVIEVRDYAK